VETLATIAWAHAPKNDIYCHAPLPDPASLYAMVQAFLIDAGAFKGPADFLNQGCSLRGLMKIAATNSYLLARCPDVLRDPLCQELDRQLALYTIIEHTDRQDDRLWVRIGGSGFLCENAYAEYEA